MLKIIATTKPPKSFYRIGEQFDNSLWYDFSKVKDVGAKTGDLVELEFEKKGSDRVLTSLKVVGTAPAKAASTGSSSSTWRSKSPEESECIRRQTVGKMVAESVKAIEGLSHDGIEDVIRNLFKVYDELTK